MSADRIEDARAPLRRWREAIEHEPPLDAVATSPSPQDDTRPTRPTPPSPEDRAAQLFRRAALPAAPDPIRLELIRRRLQASAAAAAPDTQVPDAAESASASARVRRGLFARTRWALILALLAVSGLSVAGYALIRRQAPRSLERQAPASPSHPVAPAVAGPTWSEETRRLFSATTRLRRAGDAAGALTEIEALLRLFPQGVLAPEARTLQVEALLSAGRPDEALRALEALDLNTIPRGLELRLTRAELRARQSCPRALEDFTAVLDHPTPLPPALHERALRGRATCHLPIRHPAAARP